MIIADWNEYSNLDLEGRRKFFIKIHPNYRKLEKLLFKIGGKRLIYEPEMDETFCDALISLGKLVTKEFLIVGTEETSGACHDAAAAFSKALSATWIEGYALSEDGYWRHHSWIKHKKDYLEVTPIGRLKYFGVKVKTT